ncbi:hypothetical protein E6A54_00140 [Lactobacillus johnsonii]|nr:hypothetical protein E6A54_00140 [Lactobacillus johnsonii]
MFLFCGSRNDRFKALYWDKQGFWLLYKRDDRRVDTVEQLLRRIQPLHITKHFIKRRLKTKKSKQNDQENA